MEVAQAEEMEVTYAVLRRLNLFLKLYNRTFSKVFFFMKIVLLAVSIECGYVAIYLFAHDQPQLSALYLVIYFDAIVLAVGVFQIAYGVTEGGERLRNMVWGRAGASREVSQKECRMRLRATPRFGLALDSFTHVERESVLNFLGFVTEQIAGLLISFS
jgi:hypothetical protein